MVSWVCGLVSLHCSHLAMAAVRVVNGYLVNIYQTVFSGFNLRKLVVRKPTLGFEVAGMLFLYCQYSYC